jgi:TonB-dependent starch-binding outer membrane protein SusC
MGVFGRAWTKAGGVVSALGVMMVLFVGPLAGQQEGTLVGTVLDQSNQRPLSGAQVHIPGTRIGGFVGSDGSYSLSSVPAGTHTLRVEMLGYSPAEQEVTVQAGQTTRTDFQLRSQALALDAVVVTGTAGQARRREVGTSIAQLNMDDVREPVSTVDNLLASRAPGMNVMGSSAMAGGGSQIRLRGNVSVAMSNQPLIYIDGVRMRSDGLPKNHAVGEHTSFGGNESVGPLGTVNPEDIDRIEVVKGPAATALYGTEAAGGVIQIFTKRGQEGVPQWTAQMDQGVNWMRPFGPSNEPFMRMDPWLRNAHQQRYSASVRGGGESLQYFLSGTLSDSEGVLPRDEERRYIVRSNFGFQPMPGVDLEWNTMMSRQNVSNTTMGNNPYSIALNAFRMPEGRPGNYIGSDRIEDVTRLLDYDIFTDVDRVTSGVTASHSLTPGITNRLSLGLDRIDSEMRNVRPYGYIAYPGGAVSNQRWSNRTLNVDYVGTADFRFTEIFRSSFSWGGQWVEEETLSVSARGDGLPGPGSPTVESGAQRFGYEERFRVVNAGFFFQNLFDFHDRYFLTVALRVDGNSAFGDGMGLQPYPRATFWYVLSDEAFWPDDRFGEVKLRAAWGHAGRAPGAFDAVRTWSPQPWRGETGFMPQNLGNPDLGPERTVEFEAGFDLALLDQRLSLDFTYYNQRTTDALFNVTQIPSQGFGGSQLENRGEISNRGIELAVNSTVLQRPDWRWDLGLNVYTNRSRVEDLGGSPAFSIGGGWIEEGGPVPAVRAHAINNPNEFAEPELEMFHVWGPNQPTLTVGASTSLELPRGLVISSRGEYQGGHYIQDGANGGGITRGATSPFCDEIFPLIQQGQRDQFTARERSWCDPAITGAHMVYPADFFRLRDVTLQVPVPFQVPGATRATFTVSAQNALTWKNKDFLAMDPEMAGNEGMESGLARSITEHIPPPAIFVASFRVTF